MTDTEITDKVAIRMAAMDYAEGWFEADAGRMARCLHPELVKRCLVHDPATGEQSINHLTKEDMVQYTREGGGSRLARDLLFYRVDILDVFQEAASVRVETYPYIDYLQLVKQGEQWMILNVLYTVKPNA